MNNVARISHIQRSRTAPAKRRTGSKLIGGRSKKRDQQYFAFLSYSHRDEVLAEWLHEELEDFHVPSALAGKLTANGVVPKRLAPIFRDEHELAASDDLGSEIRAALAASQYLIVLCSPNSAQSHWTNAEIEAFKRARPDGCVLAAIAAGEPFASEMEGREAEECFPPALREKYDKRGRPTGRRAEPLAADLRGDADDRRMGFLKLVAGVLGVGLDELVQRETTRRHRRLAFIAIASLFGMIIAIALAVTAIRSRDAARDQRREAEGLIAFMVGDLKDKLEPIGKLDALDGVGAKVLEYYRKQDTSDLADAGLMQRSQALSITAQVAYLRGHYDEADRLYRQALAGTAEAVRRSPDDPQRLFDHAQNVFYVGDLARQRGRFDAAEAAYREYQRLANRMTAIEPDNLKWRMEVIYANENLGIALKSKRRFDEAARLFGGVLRPLQSLASFDPANTEYQETLSNTLGWFADTESALGHLDSAIAARRRQIAFLEQRGAARNADVSVAQVLVPAHEGLGLLLTSRGKLEQGAAEYRLALTQAQSLLSIEPSNTWQRSLAADTQLLLAANLLALGDAGQAARETASACAAADTLRARDRNVTKWQSLQTSCLSMQARLALETGDLIQSRALAERALASAKSERSGDRVSDSYAVASSARLLGDLRQRAGDSAGANDAWSNGLGQLPANAAEKPWEMNERAELLRRLGRRDDARPLFERLRTMGFRGVT